MNISGATNQTYGATTAGKYKVVVTNTGTGCTKSSPATTINITCKGNDTQFTYHDSEVSVFPNPTSVEFTIRFEDNREYSIRITDLLGRTVEEFPGVKGRVIFGKEFQPGVYLVEVSSGNEKRVMKVVKQ